MIKDLTKLAVENMSHRQIRSWLTIIGIVIGIAAVVALVSLGQGLQYTVEQQFVKIGADKITVVAKSVMQGAPGSSDDIIMLTKEDLRVVQRTSGVQDAVGVVQKTAKVEFNKKIRFNFVRGVPVDSSRIVYEETGLYDVKSGRKLRPGDNKKILIGSEFSKETKFGKEIQLNDKLKLNGAEYTVVGIMGSSNPGISQAIVTTVDDARELFDAPEEVSLIMAKIYDAKDLDQVVENVKKDLRRFRNVREGKEDFTAESTKKFVESFLQVFNVISVLLIGLASISILVGAIGIANTMYTAVLERTREIGIMKSIGARNNQIMMIFLIESGLIGFVGGAIGVALGWLMGRAAEAIIAGFLGPGFFIAFFPWYLTLGSLVFAVIIGMISGIMPAKQASSMNPVDALRK
jgi:putative ABC transport system permease protein